MRHFFVTAFAITLCSTMAFGAGGEWFDTDVSSQWDMTLANVPDGTTPDGWNPYHQPNTNGSYTNTSVSVAGGALQATMPTDGVDYAQVNDPNGWDRIALIKTHDQLPGAATAYDGKLLGDISGADIIVARVRVNTDVIWAGTSLVSQRYRDGFPWSPGGVNSGFNASQNMTWNSPFGEASLGLHMIDADHWSAADGYTNFWDFDDNSNNVEAEWYKAWHTDTNPATAVMVDSLDNQVYAYMGWRLDNDGTWDTENGQDSDKDATTTAAFNAAKANVGAMAIAFGSGGLATSGWTLDNSFAGGTNLFEVDLFATPMPGDADVDGDVDFSENPLGGGDGNSDLNILNSYAGMPSGASWFEGDFDGDGDVDFTENPLGGGDGQSDLNILNSNAGTSYSDLGEDNAGGTGTAELVYDYATGKVWIETADATINTIELFTDGSTLVIDTGAVGNLNGSAPNDLNSSALQYFVSSGLPTGESLIGQILPGNLTEGDVVLGTNLLFRFARAGEAPQSGVVTLIPEPTSIALLGLGGLALLRRRRA